jgi:hypothetical protein
MRRSLRTKAPLGICLVSTKGLRIRGVRLASNKLQHTRRRLAPNATTQQLGMDAGTAHAATCKLAGRMHV